MIQSILNSSWDAKRIQFRWQWKKKVGLKHWEDEDGVSAYQFWKNFYQNFPASADQKRVTLRENMEFLSILREKEGKKYHCGKEIK